MCLEVQWWSGLCRDIPSKVKEKFYVSHLTTKKRTDCLVKLLGVYKTAYSSVLTHASILMINGQMQSWPAKGMMMTYVIRLTCLDQKYKLRGCGQESGWGVERGEDKHPLQTGQAIATGAVSRPRPSSISFPRKRGP